MNRRIEVGCLVMVKGCEKRTRYLGKIMRVSAIINPGDIRPDGITCNPSSSFAVICDNSDDPWGFSQHNPSHLLRIDDYTEETETQEEEMTV